MKKVILLIIKIVISIVLIVAVFFGAYKISNNFFKKDEENISSNETNLVNETEANELVNNEALNENIENESNTVKNTTKISEVQNTLVGKDNIYDQNTDAGSTDKKLEAIELVKQTWGEDDQVTFSCDSVTANGEYIIAVTSKTQARVLNYFKVNLETKLVQVDY